MLATRAPTCGPTLGKRFDALVHGIVNHHKNAYVGPMTVLLQPDKRAARGFRTGHNFISIAYPRVSQFKHLPAGDAKDTLDVRSAAVSDRVALTVPRVASRSPQMVTTAASKLANARPPRLDTCAHTPLEAVCASKAVGPSRLALPPSRATIFACE
jgi:hypothetical protein